MTRRTPRQTLAFGILRDYIRLRDASASQARRSAAQQASQEAIQRPTRRRHLSISTTSSLTSSDHSASPESLDHHSSSETSNPSSYRLSSYESASSDHPNDSESNDDQDDVSSTSSPSSLDHSDDAWISDFESRLSRRIHRYVTELYADRYLEPRTRIPRPSQTWLDHVLTAQKILRPDLFRQDLRMSPWCFDRLVNDIAHDPIFSNNSNNPQLPIERQLAIALYRFGHYGNAGGVQKTANWAGVAKGYVVLATRRVLVALSRQEFRDRNIRLPTEDEKSAAKAWVAAHSCHAWRHGWCLVDGTLIPLFQRPHWYGESYFDRKCRYSLNIQIVSLPNLRIIDVGYGYTGSTHDSTAWEDTKLAREHSTILARREFVWADSAYPVAKWVVAPYKKPERDLPDNEIFNKHVSMVRIRSEHAIGYLKGRFQSLKGLRVHINNEASHKFAVYWVLACIVVHNFALEHEQEERHGSDNIDDDPFIDDGISSAEEDLDHDEPVQVVHRGQRLNAGKRRREDLKRALFEAKYS